MDDNFLRKPSIYNAVYDQVKNLDISKIYDIEEKQDNEVYNLLKSSTKQILDINKNFEKHGFPTIPNLDFNELSDVHLDIAFDEMESKIDSIDDMNDEQILKLKERLKSIDLKLKDKIKPKTITISGSVHNKIKNHCSNFNFKIGDWVESVLLKEISQCPVEFLNKDQYEDSVEVDKKAIVERYYESNHVRKMIKTDKIVANPLFRFMGYSRLDNKPVYNFIGTSDKDMDSIACPYWRVYNESITTKYTEDMVDMDLAFTGDSQKDVKDVLTFGE